MRTREPHGGHIGYGGQSLQEIDDLHRLLVDEKVGLPMALTFLRRGEKRTVSVTAGGFTSPHAVMKALREIGSQYE